MTSTHPKKNPAAAAAVPRSSRRAAAALALLFLVGLMLATPARSATVHGTVADTFGGTARITGLQWTPVDNWVVYNGTNYPSLPVASTLTAGSFTNEFSGCGLYTVTVRPPTPFVPGVLAWVPCDNGSYTFQQCLALATNGFFPTNQPAFTILGRTNISATLSNGVWILDATASGGGTAYTFTPTNLPVGAAWVKNGAMVFYPTNVAGFDTNGAALAAVAPYTNTIANAVTNGGLGTYKYFVNGTSQNAGTGDYLGQLSVTADGYFGTWQGSYWNHTMSIAGNLRVGDLNTNQNYMNSYGAFNTLQIQNKATNGFAAIGFQDSAGVEQMAVGYGNTNTSQPVFNGKSYIEAEKPFIIVQTGSYNGETGYGNYNRMQFDEVGTFRIYQRLSTLGDPPESDTLLELGATNGTPVRLTICPLPTSTRWPELDLGDNNRCIAGRESNLDCMNFYEYGGPTSGGHGYNFFTGGLRAAQTLKLQIADDEVTIYTNLNVRGANALQFGSSAVTITSGKYSSTNDMEITTGASGYLKMGTVPFVAGSSGGLTYGNSNALTSFSTLYYPDGATVLADSSGLHGNANLVTNLNASQLTSGTVPMGRLAVGSTNNTSGMSAYVTDGTNRYTAQDGQFWTNITGSKIVGTLSNNTTGSAATATNLASTSVTANLSGLTGNASLTTAGALTLNLTNTFPTGLVTNSGTATFTATNNASVGGVAMTNGAITTTGQFWTTSNVKLGGGSLHPLVGKNGAGGLDVSSDGGLVNSKFLLTLTSASSVIVASISETGSAIFNQTVTATNGVNYIPRTNAPTFAIIGATNIIQTWWSNSASGNAQWATYYDASTNQHTALLNAAF